MLLVGRGGCRFLEDHPRAFHVRLVADADVRLRRVMEYRWLAEDAARALIEQTDPSRRQFYEAFFGLDWTDPLGYHVTVNTGHMGPKAVDLVAPLAEQNWARAEANLNLRRGIGRRVMEISWGIATVWMGLALLASFISIRFKLSIALVEILVGVAAGNLASC